MLHEFSYDEIQFGIALPIYGAGWSNPLNKIINAKVLPEKFEIANKEVNWNFSEIDFLMEKESIEFKLEINKFNDISLILISESTEENKQKLREWATIITEEVEKLKNK